MFHSFGYDAEEKYAELSEAEEHKEWYYFSHFKMKLMNALVLGLLCKFLEILMRLDYKDYATFLFLLSIFMSSCIFFLLLFVYFL